MTGCLYVSPWVDPEDHSQGCVPVLLADTMVTWSGLDATVKRLPSTIGSDMEGAVSSVTLQRKVQIIGQAAVAMAGEGPLIRDRRETLRWRLDDWVKSGRPMRHFGDAVNEYYPRVEAIGIYAFPAPSHEVNSMMRGPIFELPNLGLCASIGSGDQDLEALARRFDPQLGTVGRHVMNRIRAFCAAINGNRLAREIIDDAQNSWGGYVEFVYLGGDRKWMRGPKTLDFFYQVDPVGEEAATVRMATRVLAYDPGGEAARIAVVARNRDASYTVAEFQLSDQPLPLPAGEFWKGWQQETFATTFIYGTEHGPECLTLPCRIRDRQEAFFRIGDHIATGLSDEYVDRLATEALGVLGRRYIPARDLPPPALP